MRPPHRFSSDHDRPVAATECSRDRHSAIGLDQFLLISTPGALKTVFW
jgi:hypothetical protein